MKKTPLILLLLFISLSLFAEISSFDFICTDSLFSESPFNPYSFNTNVSLTYLPYEEDRDISILVYHSEQEGPKSRIMTASQLSIFSPGYEPLSFYGTGKLILSLSFLRTSFDFKDFPTFTFDVSAKGGLGAVFERGNNACSLGYDGYFFCGPELNILGTTVRGGISHLSGHYGDELLQDFEDLYRVNHTSVMGDKTIYIDDSESVYYYYGPAQYVRDLELALGIQQDLPAGFCVYANFNMPLKSFHVRPFFESPETDPSSLEHLALGEGFWAASELEECQEQILQILNSYDSSYRAIRLNAGFTWEHSLGIVKLISGFDFQAHQDGKFNHTPFGYSKSNPWEFEFSAGAGVFYNRTGLQLSYRSGRFPSLNYFNNRVRTLSLALVIL